MSTFGTKFSIVATLLTSFNGKVTIQRGDRQKDIYYG